MAASAHRPLKVGLFLWAGTGWNGTTDSWREILATARHAEAVGFDSVWLGDHLLVHVPPDPPEDVWEGWSLLSALAATTTRVELGMLVACTGFRNPALLAKMADTVDEISDGRLNLGLGAGWHEADFHAFGFPFDHRVSRFEEALIIIKTLLREGKVDFKGKYCQARECELYPRGPRPNGLPILIGATGERMLHLAAQHADIWNREFNPAGSIAELPEWQVKVDSACADVGRNPHTLERYAAVALDLPGGLRPPGASSLAGSPEQVAESLRTYADSGISHVQLWLEPGGLAGIEAFAPTLELLDRAWKM